MSISQAFFPTTRRYVKAADGYASTIEPDLTASAAPQPVTRVPVPAADGRAALSLSPVTETRPPAPGDVFSELAFHGTLEAAQLRKLDHLAARACIQPTDRVLDLGCV
jgi:hypothetical protein